MIPIAADGYSGIVAFKAAWQSDPRKSGRSAVASPHKFPGRKQDCKKREHGLPKIGFGDCYWLWELFSPTRRSGGRGISGMTIFISRKILSLSGRLGWRKSGRQVS